VNNERRDRFGQRQLTDEEQAEAVLREVAGKVRRDERAVVRAVARMAVTFLDEQDVLAVRSSDEKTIEHYLSDERLLDPDERERAEELLLHAGVAALCQLARQLALMPGER
jgi:hypothetical protein